MGPVRCSPCPESMVSSKHQAVSLCHMSQCGPSRGPEEGGRQGAQALTPPSLPPDSLWGHSGRDRRGVCQRLPRRDAESLDQAARSHLQPCDRGLQGSGLGTAGPQHHHVRRGEGWSGQPPCGVPLLSPGLPISPRNRDWLLWQEPYADTLEK